MRSSQPDDNGQLDELTISKIYRMGQTIAPGPVKVRGKECCDLYL